MSRTEQNLKVYVSALTRQRPEMVNALLRSWAQMRLPERCAVTFLIVENDSRPLTQNVVESHRQHFTQSELHYVLETEPGIPFGRNRAAKEAIAADAHLLLFVDDDEEVAEDWLVKMIDGYRKSNAVLLGAPLRARPPAGHLTSLQQTMYKNVEARYATKERRAARLTTLNSTERVTIVTNNWLAELAVFKDHNIWFDEAMRYTGGTDSKLYADVRKAGLTTGWVTDAFVYETIPPERLSFWYQYRRARDQSNTHIRRKSQTLGRSAILALAPVPIKSLFLVGQIVAIPVTAGKTMLDAARTMGWISGRIGFVVGKKSSLYSNVTGG